MISSTLAGPGSQVEMLGLYFADEDQHMDHQTRQFHQSPYASSDLLFKGTVKGQARTVFSGTIKVAAEGTRHRLLSGQPQPQLEPEGSY